MPTDDMTPEEMDDALREAERAAYDREVDQRLAEWKDDGCVGRPRRMATPIRWRGSLSDFERSMMGHEVDTDRGGFK